MEELYHAELLVDGPVEDLREGQVALRVVQHAREVEGRSGFHPAGAAQWGKVPLVDRSCVQVGTFGVMAMMCKAHQLEGQAGP
ncbi:MAG: hypothetical protein IPK99_01425 [Flavobacteriales bacterium]|nr:hypothetical protein [Flavobacteriales bacterium]